MNQCNTLIVLLLLIVSLLSSMQLRGGVRSTWTLQQGMHQEKKDDRTHFRVVGSMDERINEEDREFEHLMGAEKCVDDDEGCTERRMAAEAHLDYIYTQQHKP